MATDDADPEELEELTAQFRKVGADDPESWARAQLQDGTSLLSILTFAKALWECVIDENDSEWIEKRIETAEDQPDAPCSQAGSAMSQMLSRGVDRQAIIDFAKVLQYETLFHVCALIDGSIEPDLPNPFWVLLQTDEDDTPIGVVSGSHEFLQSMDPTGRELRPRPSLS